MNSRRLIVIFIPVFILIFSLQTFAQNQTLIGINIHANISPDQIHWNRLEPGVTFEMQIGKHSGGEIGVFYHTERITGMVNYTDTSGIYNFPFTVVNRYISVPIMYKYYSRLINVAIGPMLDFYTGWKQKSAESSVQIQSSKVSPTVGIGFLVKVSKPFSLNKHFVIEPEMRFGSYRSFEGANLGLGLSGKYRF